MYYLTNELWFPDPSEADEDGLLAVGGDLSSERLLLAYRSGIFPWYSEGQPLLWWSPNPRMILKPNRFKVSKSFRKTLRLEKFRITFNTAFCEVIEQCAAIKRKGQDGTWITSEMEQSYLKLHNAGYAKSVEVWIEDTLVGGLYGIDLPKQKVFCGESMFSKKSDASKVAFYYLAEYLKRQDYKLIDCQMYTDHLASLGAEELPRTEFLKLLRY
ncbi:leucyl/phenylalanyl-tRNA--protein transferase [Cochleicola gelatinilyticus]|uniref:Leucyl/phenylalanyl-tRNA--protein transferase n=1 Tax=Cochleicola gelatinilyticus TaxID=1763537 RepID=A0A167IT13_9FLAO|nr:leucyl/phenylalanyl-tRNA--protein transferase [Cochleicola gelatinilyticus]OAB79986.1 leucyl/phenylalanyl-tRNA--protein transferase [Cochleicola gelatinilyticus]